MRNFRKIGKGAYVMKADIHPAYKEIKVNCSCGNTFTVNSTLGKDLHVEICSACHPFYTGQQKIIDTAGRVDRFKQKYGSGIANKAAKKSEKGKDQATAA